jgi:hypothetical protein
MSETNILEQPETAARGSSPAPCSASPCNCWEETDNKCREQGYKLADACQMFDRHFRVQYGIPLQRRDGNKLKRNEPRMITISHCPWCGAKL